MPSRRKFLRYGLFGAGFMPFAKNIIANDRNKNKSIIIPPVLKMGDTVGLITPASALNEVNRTLIEAREKMESLGFKVKFGQHVKKKKGYLAGSIKERVEDIHQMFRDKEIKAIVAIRGGYGSGQLLPYLNYDLIKSYPKILLGYSDITSLLNGIYKKTGLVTFHGPVAISTFTDYTKKYFYKTLTVTEPVLDIEDAPYEENMQKSNRIWSLKKGISEGRLIGGNLTLLQATLGTPYEIDTDDAILFIEEVDEAPYDLDRILNHFKQAGKFNHCKGVLFDQLGKIKPFSRSPAFNNSLSVEEVIEEVFKDFDFPVCLGFSIGHIKDKPTLPLGIKARLDADKGRLSLLESAVV